MSPEPSTIRLGLILSDRSHYFRGILNGVLAHARKLGHIRFDFIENNFEDILAYEEPVRLDGLIAHPLSKREYTFFRRRGTAVVNISTRVPPTEIPPWVAHVVSDDTAIGQLGARQLAAMGLRDLAFFGNDDLHFSILRERGFREAFAEIEARSPAQAKPRYHCWRQGVRGFEDWLAGLPRPAGVMAAQDHYARTLMTAALESGARVPEDIAVIGVDHDPVLSELCPARLTSILPDVTRMGRVVLDTLVDIIDGRRTAGGTFLQVPPAGLHFAASAPRHHAADPAVAKALQHMQTHLAEPLDMASLAAAVGLSRRGLEYRFREQVGASPYQKLLEIRLLHARHLLTATSKTVTAIASECGFSNAREFCVRFRQKVGCTPGQFRAQDS